MAGPGRGEEAQAPGAARGSCIWLMSYATPGDHLPFSVLAAALQRAGHRVRCFGSSHASRIFTDYGLDFEPINHPVALHGGNTEVRAVLRAAASEAHYAGPCWEEDIFLDVMLLKTEYLSRMSLYNVKTDGLDNAEAFQKIAEHERKFDHLIKLGGKNHFKETLDFIIEKGHDCVVMQAEDAKIDIEACRGLRAERCRRMREYLRERAKEVGCSAFDLVEAIRIFAKRFMGNALDGRYKKHEGKVHAVKCEVDRVVSYLDGTEPKEYFEQWLAAFPGLTSTELIISGLMSYTAVTVENMLMTMEATPLEDRPSMCIFHAHLTSAVLTLQQKYGVRAVGGFSGKPGLDKSEHMVAYARFAMAETEEGMPHTPVRNMSPIAYSDWLRDTRFLSACTPLRLTDEELHAEAQHNPELAKTCRASFTGSWLHEIAWKDVPDARYFASAAERDQLLDFLEGSRKPPMCISWGVISMPAGPKMFAKLMVKALMLNMRRCIILAGWSLVTEELWKKAIAEEMPSPQKAREFHSRVLRLSYAPHEWLLPKCSLLVHNGGVGTCNAALRAGVRQIVIPNGHDQGPNGAWIRNLGVGTDTFPLEKISFGEFGSKMMNLVDNEDIHAKAMDVAQVVRAEPGVKRAVELVEEFLRDAGTPDVASSPSGTTPPYPWLEGPYSIFLSDGKKLTDALVRGNNIFVKETCLGWLRYGNYEVPDQRGVCKGKKSYDMEVFTPGVGHGYCVTQEGGSYFVSSDGVVYRYLGTVDHEANAKAEAAIAAYVQWVGRLD